MLHVPVNIRQIPSPIISPIMSPSVEQKEFIPRDDTTPIVVESVSYPPEIAAPEVIAAAIVPPIESPVEPLTNLQSNAVTYPVDTTVG
jgi:hypothetical protein